jgi:hypothetical protein
MSSTKRKAPGVELQRRVRARRESSEDLESADSASIIGGGGDRQVQDVSELDSNSEDEEVYSLNIEIETLANLRIDRGF